jgi:hypothetical protein
MHQSTHRVQKVFTDTYASNAREGTRDCRDAPSSDFRAELSTEYFRYRIAKLGQVIDFSETLSFYEITILGQILFFELR